MFRSSLTSSGSTPASSEYNTSDSDSECEFRQFHVQHLPDGMEKIDSKNGNFRPMSLIFTRLTKIEHDHRDELVRSNFRYKRYYYPSERVKSDVNKITDSYCPKTF